MAAEPDALLVRVDDHALLLPLEVVDAVIARPPITPVPGTPAQLVGDFNHQGVVHVALDRRPAPKAGRRHVVLVRSRRGGTYGRLCDRAESLVARAEHPDAELVEVEALADEAIAAYAGVAQRLPTPATPGATIRLRAPAAEPPRAP